MKNFICTSLVTNILKTKTLHRAGDNQINLRLMKKLIFVVGILLLAVIWSAAQTTNGLLLKNYTSQKTVFIKTGSKIKITKMGKTFKGNFKVISNEAITIGGDTIAVNQLQEVRSKTTSTTIGGVAWLVPGAIIGASGTAITISGLTQLGGYGIIGVVLGAPLAALGTIGVIKGVRLLSNGKKFTPSKWEYTIVNPTPLEASY